MGKQLNKNENSAIPDVSTDELHAEFLETADRATVTEGVLAVMEAVSNFYAPSHAFAYYTPSDIRQEILLMCLEVFPKFEPARGISLITFLSHHVRNRLYNLKRDKYTRPLECTKNKEVLCGKEDGDCKNCTVYIAWRQRNEMKRMLASNIGNTEYDTAMEVQTDEQELAELREKILMLEDETQLLWRKMKGGGELTSDELDELVDDLVLCYKM